MGRKSAAAPKPDPKSPPATTQEPAAASGDAPEGAQSSVDTALPDAQAPIGELAAELGAPGAKSDDADQADEADREAPDAPEPAPLAAPTAEEDVPELDDFITTHEKAAQDVDLVVTAVSHPDAKPRHHHGVYSGFPITTGPLQATYSDGSTH